MLASGGETHSQPLIVRHDPSFVGFATVTDIDDIHHTLAVIDRKDDPPVAHPNPPPRWLSLQFLDAMWPRHLGQRLDLRGDRVATLTGRLSSSFAADGLMTT